MRKGKEKRKEGRITSALLPLTAAIYFMMILEASVLPAPLSPVIKMHWSMLRSLMLR